DRPTELRQNTLTGEWVIVAPARSARPQSYGSGEVTRERPRTDPDCPFCPGNEAETPGEVLRIPAGQGNTWRVRVVPN
ncbi:MAG: galactose-1-phosphate uridylyltransferase, partial [Gemmatimonadetes bacterium]|nr:galactose-1-phosphate uridylyltransferase [Gemmatimonadota bacterium]NIS01046.1 galactose-1-phosphate uridylyltransferase [Gemmatimonadota bacterium]NIT66700.1 galactose-1-phosphate uridylyltransferase [Gemmatimonadota bacterium]NIU53866.1 galactose-1-phosphate uridylyltransferase [Gemmatimonadota bacterium]NIV23317.1 galactose-1-phosphate uridylyltransferase [Gemmatimonadota bacterium]